MKDLMSKPYMALYRIHEYCKTLPMQDFPHKELW